MLLGTEAAGRTWGATFDFLEIGTPAISVAFSSAVAATGAIGDAMELGTIKSSRFIVSVCGSDC